jgi:hypothetical protein
LYDDDDDNNNLECIKCGTVNSQNTFLHSKNKTKKKFLSGGCSEGHLGDIDIEWKIILKLRNSSLKG